MEQNDSAWRKETSHINAAFRDEELSYSSESSENLSSDSYSDGAYELEWSEKIGSKGNLFYVETLKNNHQQNIANNSIASGSSKNLNPLENNQSLKSGQVGKLKKWVKKQTYKSEDGSKKNSLHSFTSFPKVAIQGVPNGEMKEVFLDVDPKRHNYGRRATLCEVLFGIIPGHFNFQFDDMDSSSEMNDNKIMVQGLTPDGEAIRNGKFKIGDWLRSIDDIEVNMDSIGKVLATITTPRKVKLSIQRFVENSNVNMQQQKQNEYLPLVKQLNGDRCSLEEIKSSHSHFPHIVLYLTIGNDDSANNDGVMYKFPEEDSTLLSLKGMFITLNHMVADVTSSSPLCSTLIVDEELVHVGYIREGREVMVLALPDSCVNSSEIQWLSNDIGRLMRLQFQTLGKTFGDCENKALLDHFFLLFFHHCLLRASHNHKCFPHNFAFIDTLPCTQSYYFTAEIEVQLDTILNEIESADFGDMSEAHYNARRLYTVLGCCVFYKIYLLANHLPKEDLLDVFLYVRLYQLLSLISQEQVSQIVIWREIFPTRHFNDNGNHETNIRDYTEPNGRWFLLIVALKHTLLGMILEAGGCSAQAKGHPSPDPFYVDQAQHTLMKLETCGIISHLEKHLEFESSPQISCADWFVSKNKTVKRNQSPFGKSGQLTSPGRSLNQKSLSQSNLLNLTLASSPKIGTRKMQEVTSILKKKSNLDGEKQQLLSTSGQDIDSDVDATTSAGTSDDMTPILGQRGRSECNGHTSASSDADSRTSSEGVLYKSQKSHRIFASNFDLSNVRKGLEEAEENSSYPTKLVAGRGNTLFHYIDIDIANGIFVAPTEHVQKWICESLHTEIVKNFYRCCLQIHKLFQATLKQKEMVKNRETSKVGVNMPLNSVKEHGILFHFTPPSSNNPKKLPPTIAYWVVGRLFFTPSPHEVYICFHDSASQNIIELAFRLGFGVKS